LLLRQGHLSERAIIDAVMVGNRPAHLDRCDVCADRAVQLGRWLDDTRALGLDTADAAFSTERLSAQRAQIMRRLEQLDEPARVISFPRHAARLEERQGRRVAASWVAVAAAAGLVVGVIGGQFSARLATPPAEGTVAETPVDSAGRPVDTSYLQYDFDESLTVGPLQLLDEITPRIVQTSARAGG
jgi:hypothetical protein